MFAYLGPYLLGPNSTPENGVYTGDARELAQAIPDKSVDLIFTDPVYWNIDDYRWLAETAARVLKERGNLLVYVTQEHLPFQIEAMTPYLHWAWLFGIQLFGRRAAIWNKKVQACGQMLAWLAHSMTFDHSAWVDDFVGVNTRLKTGHKWRKGIQETLHYLTGFSEAGAVVWEPFAGGGTIPAACKMLERFYLAFEIVPETAEAARQNVREAQPPLFVPQAEQIALPI